MKGRIVPIKFMTTAAWSRMLMASLLAALLLTSVDLAPVQAGASTSLRETALQAVTWTQCEGGPVGRECGTVTAPRDYDSPAAGTYPLQVARSRATDMTSYKGVLIYMPGGPAQTGAWTVGYDNLTRTFSPEVLAQYDIVGYNQLGVPEGVPCLSGDPLRQYWEMDHTPDGSAVRTVEVLEREKQYNLACAQNDAGQHVPYMHTARTVQDVERIRQALGVSKFSIWAMSYGTAVAHAYMAKFPSRVDVAVLDSVMDRSKSDHELFLEQTKAFENTWTYFKAWAQQQTSEVCGLKGQNIDAVFSSLLATARVSPIPGPHAPTGSRAANDWMIVFAAMWATSAGVPNYQLACDMIEQAAAGDASWIVYIYDSSSGRTVEPDGDVVYVGGTGERRAISCNDSRWSQLLTFPGSVQNLVTQAKAVAPVYGEAAVFQNPAQCYKWPLPPKSPPPLNGAVAAGPKVLLVSGSLDAFTPLTWAQRVQQMIPGSRLLVRKGVTVKQEGTGHGNVYYSDCVKNAQTVLLVNKVLPAAGTVCLSDASKHSPIEPPPLYVAKATQSSDPLAPFIHKVGPFSPVR